MIDTGNDLIASLITIDEKHIYGYFSITASLLSEDGQAQASIISSDDNSDSSVMFVSQLFIMENVKRAALVTMTNRDAADVFS